MADFDEILVTIIDWMIRAEPAHRGAFLVISGGGENHRAMSLGDLDRGAADAARAALDKNRLCRLQRAPVHHVRPDRAIDLR